MDIRVKATNINFTDNISEYLEKRLSALDRLISKDDTSVLCDVEVEKTTEHHQQGDIYRFEINLHIAGREFRTEVKRDRLFDAIDEAKEQMARELRRHKNKQQQNIRRGGAILKDLLKGFGKNKK